MAWLGVLLLLIGPAAGLHAAGARWQWFALGVLSWALALALKVPLSAPLYRLDEAPRFSPATTATLHGLISALTELGLAALFLRGRQLPWPDVLAFGVGIGAFEIIWLLLMGALELHEQGSLTWPNVLAMGNAAFLAERGLTVVGHAASRVLVYAALVQGSLGIATFSAGLFTLIDGVAVYGALAGWNWEDEKVLMRFTLFLAVVGVLEAAAAWHFGRAAFERQNQTTVEAPPAGGPEPSVSEE